MEHNEKGYMRDVKHPTLPVIIRFDNSVINYDQAFDKSDYILMNRTGLKPIGPIGSRAGVIYSRLFKYT